MVAELIERGIDKHIDEFTELQAKAKAAMEGDASVQLPEAKDFTTQVAAAKRLQALAAQSLAVISRAHSM